MKKNVLITIAVIAVVITIVAAGLYAWVNESITPERVTNSEVISWLDASSPKSYPAAKAEIKKLLAEELDIYPEWVAFRLVENDSGMDYRYVHIYYKDTDANTWYGFSLNWLSSLVSYELDHELIAIARG